jgi:serine/threonine protein kinase
LVPLIRLDLACRLQSGEARRVEAYLQSYPDLARNASDVLDLLKAEFDLRRRQPPIPELAEYDRRFPKLAAALRQWVGDPLAGDFRLRRFLSEGTYGRVWLADDLHLPQQVALKTLRHPKDSPAGRQALEALRKDAAHLTKLRHPNIVRVFAWREANDEHFLVLEYVAGGSLADRLKAEGPLDWQQAARYVADVADGLLAVHHQGIIHRDIKPANILWDPQRDEALLTDFGVSARLSDPLGMAGTLPFMAPEALAGRTVVSSDVYSLAASLFQLVTGDVPFPGTSARALADQIAQGLVDPDPRCRALPESLERIIRAGLAAKPERRPLLPDFLDALRGCLNQLLADSLMPAPDRRPAAVGLQLLVSSLGSSHTFGMQAPGQPKPGVSPRDLKKVPRPPEQLRLRTGDRIRIELVAERDGWVAVFNIGPTGNLNLLHPNPVPGGAVAPAAIQARQALHILDVELLPPPGRERLFAVWCRVPLSLDRLLSLGSQDQPGGSRPYHASRDIKRLQESVQLLPAEDWSAVVLELNHSPAPERLTGGV